MLKSTQTGYYDLNVNESCFQNINIRYTLETLYNFGYRTVAINQTVETDRGSSAENKKKKKKGEPRDVSDCVPNPFNLQHVQNVAEELGLPNMTFLSRLTLIFSHQDKIRNYIKSNNFKKYDIIAVTPTTGPAMIYTYSSLEADILTFDPLNRFSMKLSRKIYNQLVDKGFHLELNYSHAIEDSSKRKNLIHLSHLYHTYGKSRNVVFSSGASNHMLLRGAYDVISLGFIFGLSELQAKNAVLHLPRNVTVNAMGRRQGKAVMFVENIEENLKTEDKEDTGPIVIDSDEDKDENMDTDEPAQKKSKQ